MPRRRPGAWCSQQRGLWGTSLGLFSSNYLWYFMLGWLPGYLVEEHGFSMHEMEHVGTARLSRERLRGAAHRLAVDRYVRRGGSANFAWKLVMVVAHAARSCFMLDAWPGAREHVAVAAMFGFQVMMGASSRRRLRHVADPRGTAGVGALGGHPELGGQPLGHAISTGVHRLHRASVRAITARLRRRRRRERLGDQSAGSAWCRGSSRSCGAVPLRYRPRPSKCDTDHLRLRDGSHAGRNPPASGPPNGATPCCSAYVAGQRHSAPRVPRIPWLSYKSLWVSSVLNKLTESTETASSKTLDAFAQVICALWHRRSAAFPFTTVAPRRCS